VKAVLLILDAVYIACAIVAVTPGVPWRWSLTALLTITHLGLPGLAGGHGDPAIDNALKAVILPTALLVRTRFAGLRLIADRPLFGLWIALMAYAGFSATWSPFPADGLKGVGYMFGYTATVLVFRFSLERDPEDVRIAIRQAAWFGLATAGIQTYVLGGRYAGADPGRFSSFVAPQSYGVFLALTFGLLIALHKQNAPRALSHDLLLALLVPAVFLNGSRFALAVVVGIVVWSSLAWLIRYCTKRRLMVASAWAAIGFAFLLSILSLIPQSWWSRLKTPSDLPRAAAPLGVLTGSYHLRDIGTLRFRLEMYEAILDYAAGRSPAEKWLGSGSGSVGEVVATGYYEYRGMDFVTVDPNRVAHNEFLHVFYDYGLLGLSLFSVLCLALGVAALRRAWIRRDIQSWVLLALVGVVLTALASQNLFAASTHPSGMTVSLILAAVLHSGSDRSKPSAVTPPDSTN